MKRYSFTCEDSGERVDKALAAFFPDLSRSYIQKLIADNMVTADGRPAQKSTKTAYGMRLDVMLPDMKEYTAEPEDIPLDIAYEDGHLLVVNKAKGMVVHPAAGNYSGTLVNALLAYCGDSLSGINGVLRPGIVHRLDKDTSGLLIVAKTDAAHKGLAEQIKEHSFTRRYEAVIVGTLKQSSGTVNAPIARDPRDRKKMAVVAGGREAVTHYETLASYGAYSHVRLTLETGRTHQIRVHMAYSGHPVVCDEVYGGKPQFSCCRGQCLHAKFIAFKHPVTGEHIELESELPEYFTAVLEKIGKT